MKTIFILFFLSIPFFTYPQSCDCESNFQWLQKTFEDNDAGFSYAVDNKGKQAYAQHNEAFTQTIQEITTLDACMEALYEWLTFFRSGHIAIRPLQQAEDQSGSQSKSRTPSKKKIREQFQDWETVDLDIDEFVAYAQSKQEVDYEGTWVSGQYNIGIKKIADTYVGFILEADGVYWTEKQVKLKIQADNSATFYMKDHSPRTFAQAELLGNNHLKLGFVNLKRTSPTFKNSPAVERHLRAISSDKPYFEEVDAQTTLLRIPSFRNSEKKAIDDVIQANREQILAKPNLIIDLRNNGGGSDGSFGELLPILYTDPIRTVGVELRSTPMNNQRMLAFVNDPKYGFDEEDKKWAQESYEKLSERIGEFVNLDSTIVDITTFDTIYANPANIGIIIHEHNGSTTEQFLLAAKQSKKVKLFGTTTAGVLDISNMFFIPSPCEEFELGYCLSRSMRIPEMTIDEKGIQPDYYIDKSVPPYQWLEFVQNILNQ
ncbi:MAG: S41 family peptidase [Bacteroidota bacterium]